MISKRIIPCLDVRDGKLTKGIKFKGNVDIGDPVEVAREYYEQGADEIVFYDITASAEGRDIMIDVVKRVAHGFVILGEAAWIPDSGRWSTFLSSGTANEVEPFPDEVAVSLGSIVDVAPWSAALPRSVK